MWSEVLPPVSPTMRWRMIISFCVIVLVFFALWSLGALGWLGIPGFARQDSAIKLESRMVAVEDAIKLADLRRERDYLTAWVSELNRDIFALERDIASMERVNKSAPSMFIEHLNKMKHDRERAQRRLEHLEREHPEVARESRTFTAVQFTGE